jgi:hypothetical protein
MSCNRALNIANAVKSCAAVVGAESESELEVIVLLSEGFGLLCISIDMFLNHFSKN